MREPYGYVITAAVIIFALIAIGILLSFIW